jgi:hypothetical protein
VQWPTFINFFLIVVYVCIEMIVFQQSTGGLGLGALHLRLKKQSYVRPLIFIHIGSVEINFLYTFFIIILQYTYVSGFEFLIKMIDSPRPVFTFSCTKNIGTIT